MSTSQEIKTVCELFLDKFFAFVAAGRNCWAELANRSCSDSLPFVLFKSL